MKVLLVRIRHLEIILSHPRNLIWDNRRVPWLEVSLWSQAISIQIPLLPLPSCMIGGLIIFRYVRPQSLSHVQLFVTPMDCGLPGSSVQGIFQQEYWSWLPFSPQGDLPNPGIKPISLVPPAQTGGCFMTEPPGRSSVLKLWCKNGDNSGDVLIYLAQFLIHSNSPGYVSHHYYSNSPCWD